MKITIKNIILTIVAISFLASTGFAGGKKGRKLPVGSYITSAKINILSGDFSRYKEAEFLLDSLFMHYGPHAEGLHLMGQMMVDYIDKTPGISEKTTYVERIVAYNDSLHLCKANKEVKKKYKKNIDEYIVLSDSMLVKYWRDFYNAGIEQKNMITELQEQMQDETDTSYLASIQTQIDSNVDSAVANIKLSLYLDDNNYLGYIGIGSVYEKVQDYPQALTWLKKGLDEIEDRGQLLLNIAYNHIQIDQYCEAIPYFKEHIELKPEDVNNMFNLGICYNNCKHFDSAMAVNVGILEIDPEHTDALGTIGRYYNQRVRDVSDSINVYQKAENDEQVTFWGGMRNNYYDSSMAYFKKITEITPDDDIAQEQYGMIAALRGDYEAASTAFTKLTEIDPGNVDYWRYLGDCHVRTQKFTEAAGAYEKVVATNDTELETWERLVSLYNELKMTDKKKAAEAKVKSLQ